MKPHKNCRRDQILFFRTRYHPMQTEGSAYGFRQLRSQDLVPVHAHRTEEVTRCEGREGANGVSGGIGAGGGNGDGNGVGYGNGDADGAGTGTGTELETNKGAQNGNEDGSGDGAGTGKETKVETRGRTQDRNEDGSGDVNQSSSRDGDGDGEGNGNGNEGGIGKGGRGTKKRKKPHNNCSRHVGNGGDLGGKRKHHRK